MSVDENQTIGLHAVPDPVDDDGSLTESVDETPEAFRSGWLAGGLQDRLAA